MTETRPRLSAEGLRKSYRGRTVVDGVSLHVEAGEIVGLLGPNGAGKTTTFSIVVGLVEPDGGQVLLGGEEITELPMFRRARQGVGYLPQEASVFRKMTALENLVAILETLSLSRNERLERAHELLDRFKLPHLANSVADTLSGGERRRLEIARALAAEPRFILLDEPFAGVDPLSVSDIQRIVRHLADRGIGVLITDHNVRETLGICGRAYIVNQGHVIASGSAEDILANAKVREVYLGENFKL